MPHPLEAWSPHRHPQHADSYPKPTPNEVERWKQAKEARQSWIGTEIKHASERRAEHVAAQEAERRAVDVRGVLRQAHVLRSEAAAEVQRFFRYKGGALQVLKAPAAPLTT
jgi:hypothetical protein